LGYFSDIGLAAALIQKKEQITDRVDTSVDPMTVVAKGAALFASTISVSDEVKETTRDKTKLQLDIKYEATTVELDEMVNLKVLKEKTTGSLCCCLGSAIAINTSNPSRKIPINHSFR
jgi:hypothetical protein